MCDLQYVYFIHNIEQSYSRKHLWSGVDFCIVNHEANYEMGNKKPSTSAEDYTLRVLAHSRKKCKLNYTIKKGNKFSKSLKQQAAPQPPHCARQDLRLKHKEQLSALFCYVVLVQVIGIGILFSKQLWFAVFVSSFL